MEFASEPVLFKCGICSKTFKYNRALNSHLQKLHQQPLECTKNFEVVELNPQNHPSQKNSNNCLQMAHSASSISLEDKENVEKAAKLKCTECGKRFQRPGTLNKHINRKHPEVYVPSKMKEINFFCNTCDCGFTYRKTLIRHIQDKHPEEMSADISSQAYNCPICSVKFEYYVNLKQHMKHFHPDESHFPKERSFRHFRCDICKMHFQHRFDLTRHKLREHPFGVAKEMIDSKRFACGFCPKRFSYKYNMHLHSIKKHPNEWKTRKLRKPGSCCCAECGKWYSSKMTITSHLRRKHPSTIKPSCQGPKNKPQTVKPVVESDNKNTRGHRVCPLCSKTFLRKEAIYEHFRAEHGKRIATHSMEVEDEAAFHEWKQRFENEAKCKFVKYNNYKSKKELVKILICHRSGCFQSRSRGVRHLRLNGSEKINGFCPAEVRFVHNLTANRCTVHYIDEHVGHGPELQFLKLKEPSKMLDSMPEFEVELDESCGQSEPNLDDKHLFDTIVLSAWITENEDSVLYIKGPEEADPQFPELNTGPDGDFVFIIMNEFQATMFAKYASDIVAVARMEGPNDYELELFVVMVVDNFRQGIPCCMMLSNRSDQYVYELLFAKLGERAGRVKPSVFMSDVCDTYANAWNAMMPAPHHQLYCSWGVKRCWEKNLSRIECRTKRKAVRQFLRCLQMELNVFRFDELLQQLLSTKDAELNSFPAYFRQNFLKNESKWAYCYRKYAGINTNYVCDRFFRSLRHSYLRGRSTFSLEQILDALSMLLMSLPQEKLIREVKGKLVSKIKEARVRHSMVAAWPTEQLYAINRVSETKWLVPSADDDKKEEIYHVEKVQDECDCKLVCQECSLCLHQYRCTCLDNCIQFNMCVHIHAVCFLEKGLKTDSSCDMIEELIVDVVATDTTDMCSEIEDYEDSLLLRIEEG